jgi:DNA-directed RNA polymerase specialized sigma24 family protein
MAANTFNISPRNLLYDAILEEIRTWSEFPRRIFTQAHYGGQSVEEIAEQTGCGTQEVRRILEAHESRLRKALARLRRRK